MRYTSLGKTGVQVSKICLGCMSFGTQDEWNQWVLSKEDAGPFFKQAIESGINFFDTADAYSQGRSEEITGYWLKEYGQRDELVIATKTFFPMSDGPNQGGLSRKKIQQSCEMSLRRLQVDVIDLYQIHRLDPHTPGEETLTALDQLVRQGKVRYIGASSMYAWELMKMLSISEKHSLARFVSMQNFYNLLYREEEREMLALCQAEGIAVIPWSPLARGFLAKPLDLKTMRSQSDNFINMWFGSDADKAIVDTVIAIAEEREITPAQVALAWLFSKPAVTAPIIGATKVGHITDAVTAIEIELSAEEIERLEAAYVPKPSFGITPPFAFPKPGAVHDRG